MSDTEHHPVHKKASWPQLIVVVLLLVGAGVAAGFSFASNDNSKKDESSATTTQSTQAAKVGDAVTKGDFTFRVDKVATVADDPVFKPAPGDKIVVTDVYFSNQSGSTVAIVPVTQVYLKDSDGNTYYISPASLEKPLAGGNLLSGDNLSGQLSFNVPTSATGVKLYLEPGWPNFGTAVVDLNL